MAAIMVGDIVGYSAMMEQSEETALGRLAACDALIEKQVASFEGRIFNKAGDATLAEFASPINALRCAVGVGVELAGASEPGEAPMRMRFGLHLADVAVRGDDLLGDGVNLTARLQQGAPPGAVWASGTLFDQVRRNSPYIFDDLGERRFKNLSEPVRVYQVRGEIGAYRLQAAPTRAAGDKAKRPNSLAVMPFRAQGADEEQRFLAEGLTEELIVELGRFRRLSVASRSASFAIAESVRDPVKAGEALRVRFVLDGQVRKAGGSLRIALTLAETDSGAVVWSDKIVRSTEEFWDALDETAAKIAATVVGRVEEASMVSLRRRPPENYEAFECLLRGVEHHRLGGVTDDNAREAVKWFSRAIDADPHYAAAYAYRVCAASWLPEFDFELGLCDVRKANELDPCDAESNRILGFMEFVSGHDEAAKSLMARASQLNPTDAFIKARNAAITTFLGDPERALALVEEAENLDPLLPVYCVEERGVALYALGRYGEALDALTRLVFQTYRSRLYRAASLVALGRTAQARKLCDETVAGNPGMNVARFLAGERFRDLALRERLGERVAEAGLPA
jgi:TolB-like protein/class 3 adenylate cyclase/Flp pilus assembly protein TadD